MHPDDHTLIAAASLVSSQVPSQAPSALNSGVNTPRSMLSRRNSTSTFSTTFGLAKMLNERGIKAVTPSCISSPDKNFFPTTTPCNSPDGSPRSGSPTPTASYGSGSMAYGIFASGAELLKRTFSGETTPQPTPQQTPTNRKSRRETFKQSGSSRKQHYQQEVKVVERLERFGFDSIMASGSGISQLALPGTLYSRRDSPMAQLTFLKGSMSSEKLGGSSDGGSSAASIVSDDSRCGVSFASGRDERTEASEDLARRARRRTARSAGADALRSPTTSPGAAAEEDSGGQPTATATTLGTIGSLLFGAGRKGGLL